MNHHNTPLVFIPGWGFQATVWQPIAEHFHDHAITFSNLTADSTSQDTLATLSMKLNETLPEGSTLIAWSLGGLFAIMLCHMFPYKYKGLVLSASTPCFYNGNKHQMQFLKQAESNLSLVIRKFRRLVLKPCIDKKVISHLASHQLSDEGLLLHHLQLLFSSDLREIFSCLSTPCLQVFGEHDAILPYDTPQQTHKLIPGGHAFFLSHKNEFIHYLKEFLYD